MPEELMIFLFIRFMFCFLFFYMNMLQLQMHIKLFPILSFISMYNENSLLIQMNFLLQLFERLEYIIFLLECFTLFLRVNHFSQSISGEEVKG